jgi:hypothetical protein
MAAGTELNIALNVLNQGLRHLAKALPKAMRAIAELFI